MKIVTKNDYKIIKKINLKNLNKIMLKDKKTLDGIIKLTVPKNIGYIKFYNQKLNTQNIYDLTEANKIFIKAFHEKKFSN